MKLSSRLVKSRHGIYYYRLQISGYDKRWSLGTRDPLIASITAYNIGAKILSMKIDPTKIKGWTLKTDGKNIELQTEDNDADRQSAKEALVAYIHASKHSLTDDFQANTQQSQAKTKLLFTVIDEYALHLPITNQALKSQKMALRVLNNLSKLLGPDFDISQLNDDIIEETWFSDRLNQVAKTTAKRDLTFIKSFVDWCADKNLNNILGPFDNV